MEYLKFDTVSEVINKSREVDVVDNCNGYTAINTGTTVMRVNEIILNPGVPGTRNGDAVTIGGSRGELYSGKIMVKASGPGSAVTIIQKFYI